MRRSLRQWRKYGNEEGPTMTKLSKFKYWDASIISILIESAKPNNEIFGKTIPPLIEWRFCDVMDFAMTDTSNPTMDTAIDMTLKVIQMHHPKITLKKLLSSNAEKFVSLFRFILDQLEILEKLMSQLESEPDPDMINAGVDRLNRFGVLGLYYAISKDPTDWDRISEVPFGLMFNKLMLDKTHSEIQKKLNDIAIERQKRKR